MWPARYVSLTELTARAREGMPALEVIRAATINGAELLGIGGITGSIESNKAVDIIAVPGDPLSEIRQVLKV